MTTTTLALTAGLALCLVAIVALSVSVSRLRSEVRRLAGRVGDQRRERTEQDPAPGRPERDSVEDPPAAQAVAVPVITAMAQPADDRPEVTGRSVAGVALAEPLIKALSFGHGLRRALAEERRLHYRVAMRKELRRQRRIRRHHRPRAAGQGWRS